uniref:Uncharacterized protein n=1 Tax=Romanomermis culicivorax TaxID=13658 RepID=A0A915JH87_ROMCU
MAQNQSAKDKDKCRPFYQATTEPQGLFRRGLRATRELPDEMFALSEYRPKTLDANLVHLCGHVTFKWTLPSANFKFIDKFSLLSRYRHHLA